jgi:hypothetical protein
VDPNVQPAAPVAPLQQPVAPGQPPIAPIQQPAAPNQPPVAPAVHGNIPEFPVNPVPGLNNPIGQNPAVNQPAQEELFVDFPDEELIDASTFFPTLDADLIATKLCQYRRKLTG